MSEASLWVLIADAPVNVVGLVWGESLGDRTDTIGLIREFEDGERVVVTSVLGHELTHWHPLPRRP